MTITDKKLSPLEPMLLENRLRNAEVALIEELSGFLKEAYNKTMKEIDILASDFKTKVDICLTENTFGTLMGFMHILTKKKSELKQNAETSSSVDRSNDGRSNVLKSIEDRLRKNIGKYSKTF